MKRENDAVRACRLCSCTDDHACEGGCWWMGPDICSGCCLGFVVVVMGSHPVRFIEPTQVRKAFAIETLEKATRFDNADTARIRATAEMSRSQFTVAELLKCPACGHIFTSNDAKAVAFHMEHLPKPAAEAAPAEPVKRGRGRPKGAKTGTGKPKPPPRPPRALPLQVRPEGVRYSARVKQSRRNGGAQ